MIKKLLTSILVLALVIPAAPPAQSEIPETLSLQNLAIPQSLGKVQDRFTGTSKRWVIQIQDVHGHVTAQENISAILDHLQVVYGVKTVAVEGGWLSSSLPKSWGLPQSREKQMLARALLEDGYLTGPGYAAIFSSMPLTLVGVEDPKLYLQNREVFLSYLNDPKSVDQKIKTIETSIQEEKNGVFSPELLGFDKKLVEFREGSKAESFFPALIALAGEHKIDLLNLGQVALFAKILDVSQIISQDKLKGESERLTVAYKAKRLSFEELLRSGKIPQEDLEYYPEMQKYIEVMKLQDKMEHVLFFDQIELLIKQVKEKLFASDVEKMLDQKSERFQLAKKLLTFKATPKDVVHFSEDQAGFETLIQEGGFEASLELSKRFYELAQKRDEIFFQKLIKDERLNSDVAIVTGGFHTDGLSAQLRAAGISYIVITPDLANEQPNEKMYHEMLEINSPAAEAQTLSAYRSELRESFDKGFLRGAKASVQGGRFNVDAGKEIVIDAITAGTVAPQGLAAENPTLMDSPSDADFGTQLQVLFKHAIPVPGKPALPNVQRTFIVVTASQLQSLTEEVTPEALRAWAFAANNPANTIIVLSEDGAIGVPSAAVGMIARLSVFKAANFEDALNNPKFRARFKKELATSVAVIAKAGALTQKTSALLLEKDPFSFLIFRLALLNEGLRRMVSTPEGYSKIKSLLSSFEVVREYLKSA
ncbi:MAG: hypothetical protein EXS63_02035 [Candidatus Omnitrophica bacterium]|nr:hypothetical protein [Candidatus Omnitrophota bacterium]